MQTAKFDLNQGDFPAMDYDGKKSRSLCQGQEVKATERLLGLSRKLEVGMVEFFGATMGVTWLLIVIIAMVHRRENPDS